MAPPRKPVAAIGKKLPGARKSAPPRRVVVQNARSRPAASNPAGHTIILLQETQNKATRTWSDHNSLKEALDAFVSEYEKQLRSLNPQARQLTYTVKDLHGYIDQLADLSALVYSPSEKLYAPRGKAFFKEQLLLLLQAAAR